MEAWNFKVKSNPKGIYNKLESVFGPAKGFVFNSNRGNDNRITFSIRKRILYGWYWAFHNWTILNGTLLKSDTENETNVEISFMQHFLINLIIYSHMLLGLGFIIIVILGISSNPYMYILGGIILALGIILWIGLQKKFKKDIQKYKELISEIIEQ